MTARSRRTIAIALAVALVAVVGMAAVRSVTEARGLVEQRSELVTLPPGDRESELVFAGDEARAIRAFRGRIAPGDRFALVLGETDGDTPLRLLAQYSFYPAVEVPTARAADVIVSFGADREPPAGFEREVTVGDAWLARRSS